jgi:hypothetical protein
MSRTTSIVAALIAALGLPALAVAQTAGPPKLEPVTLKDLKTPASPSFQLLGIAPSDVERPTTPRAFAVSLLSALQQSDTVLPNGLAVDVAPYWLVPHNSLQFADYIDPKVGQSLRQTFAVSVATTKATVPASEPGAIDVGLGVRTSPWAGKSTQAVAKLKTLILVSLKQASIVQTLIDVVGTPTQALPPSVTTIIDGLRKADHPDMTDENFKAMLDGIVDRLEAAVGARTDLAVVQQTLSQMQAEGDASRKKWSLELQRVNQRRLGFTLDVASAFVTRTSDNGRGGARVTREGVWSTAGYNDEHLSFLGLLRYVGNSENRTSRSDLLDLGARLVGTLNNLDASFEFVSRLDHSSAKVDDSTYKAVGNVEYKVSEDVSISATFGKDFGDTRFGRPSATLALLGVNFGLGGRPTLPVTAK